MTSYPPPPALSHILETCIYVRSVEASAKFYKKALNIEPFLESPRVAGFSLGSTTLLLFELGKTTSDVGTPGGMIPRHGPSAGILSRLRSEGGEGEQLKQHFCFAVQDPAEVRQWVAYLRERGIPVISRVSWERGGRKCLL